MTKIDERLGTDSDNAAALSGPELAASVGGNNRQTVEVMQHHVVQRMIDRHAETGQVSDDDLEDFMMLMSSAGQLDEAAKRFAQERGFKIMTAGHDRQKLANLFADTPFAEFIEPPTEEPSTIGKLAIWGHQYTDGIDEGPLLPASGVSPTREIGG